MASGPITSWQIDGETMETMETVRDFIVFNFYFGGLQHHCRWWLQPWNSKMLAPWRKAVTNLDSILKSRDITLPSRLVITFLPRSRRLLISWLQSPSAVMLEPRKIKSDTVSTVSASISHEVMGLDAMIFIFWMLTLSQLFHSPLFHFHQEAFEFLFTFCHKGGAICISEVVYLHIHYYKLW